MGHQSGVFHQTFDSSEGFGEGDNFDGLQDGGGLVDSSLDVEAHHSSGPSHVLFDILVIGEGFESGVEDFLNFWVAFQPFSNDVGVLGVLFNSGGKGFETP